MAERGRPPGPRGGDSRGGRGGSRDGSGGAAGGKRSSSSDRRDKPFSRPRRDDGGDAPRGGGRRDDRAGGGGAPAGPRGGDRRGDRRSGPPRDERRRTSEQATYDGPPLDDSITGRELDRSVAQQLRGLPEKLAARVARHLVAAGMLMDTDPATAYQHTLAARGRAARIAVVREACGEAAYAAGEFAEALSELRAAKRMNGSQDYLAVMADCERALGRPDRALALARNPAVADLEPALKAEMTIVEAGARRDLGEVDAALRTLENAPLRSRSRADWVVRLRYAYADTLLAAGRTDEAIEWFHRTVGVDAEEITDAADRVAELESGAGTDSPG
jgi:tetratricopeptide (TPR) repeat protein